MASWKIEFNATWQHSPMTYFVYRPVEGQSWPDAKVFNPQSPSPIPGKGYAMYFVKSGALELRFASLLELEHFIQVMSRPVLPTTAQLIHEAGLSGFTNHAWLGRLPAGTHSKQNRRKLIPVLERALAAFRVQVT